MWHFLYNKASLNYPAERAIKKRIKRTLRYPLIKGILLLKKQVGFLRSPLVQAFRGYANEQVVHLRGRVVEDGSMEQPELNDTFWDNSISMFKRYAAQGLPDVPVQVRVGSDMLETVTDEDGYFEVNFPTSQLPEHKDRLRWVNVGLKVIHPDLPEEKETIGEVLYLGTATQYGIISDVDDTFLVTHSTQKVRKLRLFLAKNAISRKPFDGVVAFYQALHHGTGEQKKKNPIFYVSSSDWALYDLLEDFRRIRKIPKGVFLLRDIQNNLKQYFRENWGNHNHKFDKIERIMETYPQLPFILIGDSGQRDAEIYAKATAEFPGRIKAIYIRDIGRKSRQERVQQCIAEAKSNGVDMLLAPSTVDAAIHAVEHDFIEAKALTKIIKDKQKHQELELGIELASE